MWIVSKRYDLTFIFGGAAASLLVPFVVLWNPALLPLLFWIWLLVFDGTHLWAAYSRTYMDAGFWKTDRQLLIWSPIVFLLPLTALLLHWYSRSIKPIELFLLLAQGWAYFHLVRQHYGFVSLYDRKSGADRHSHKVNKWTLYIALWSSYIFFLITHPMNRRISGLPELPLLEVLLTISICAAVSGFLFFHYRKKSYSPAVPFVLICIALYGLIFYWVAPMEPFFANAENVVQSFLLLAIMMTLFHNIQYHAIVWHYNRKKYANSTNGPASYVNKNFFTYAAVALGFAAIYAGVAWQSTDYPSFTGQLPVRHFVPIAFFLWWGFLFHHYYLDQKIWRISKTGDLRTQFELSA